MANAIQFILFILSAVSWFPVIEALFPFLLISFAGLVCSIPPLVAAYFCFDLVAEASLPVNTRFLVWLLVYPTIVLVEGLIGLMIFRQSDLSGLLFCVPGIAAAFLSVLVRYRAFTLLVSSKHSVNAI